MPLRAAMVISCLALAPAVAEAATNLVGNPGFDAGLGHWLPTFGSEPNLSWSPVDELGKDSGSLRFAAVPDGVVAAIDSECFPVTPGTDLVFGAAFWTSATQGGVWNAQLRLFEGAGCAGDPEATLADLGPYFSSSTNWRPLQGFANAGAGVLSGSLRLFVVGELAADEARFDNAFVYENATCATASTVSCLGQRFRVAIEWQIPDGTRGGALLRAFTGDSAYASFFDPANVEVVFKVLDGCAVNERFWVFAAGLTNVHVVLRITDTREGVTWIHVNPEDTAFAPVQDTSAFATCPH